MAASICERIQVIDVDTHVLEPPDLWTARINPKWGDAIPHVGRTRRGEDVWFMGGEPLYALGLSAMAGWKEYFPDHPATFEDVAEPGASAAKARLGRMDEQGIFSQVVYPNVGGFGSGAFLRLKEPELMIDCVRAYNDYLSEWCAADPKRLIAITALPFWDVYACIEEIARCARMGHKGILFTSEPQTYDMPDLGNPYWDPVFALAQDLGLPVNFHIGSGNAFTATGTKSFRNRDFVGYGNHANAVKFAAALFLNNSNAISEVIVSGLCHRFPKLNFVSVESGIGWVPFHLEALDWQWQNTGVRFEHPEYDLLPSEYFARQIYACFWFERGCAKAAIELLGPDNILYETDYPHPTSMSPGPASVALDPKDFIEETLGYLPEDVLRKVLHDNAARIYHLDG